VNVLIALNAAASPWQDYADVRVTLVALLFGVLGLGFLYAFFRFRGTPVEKRIESPLQLSFNEKDQVHSDGQGGKTVTVLVKNTSLKRTLKGIDVKLKGLSALNKHRPGAPIEMPELETQLQPEPPAVVADAGLSLAPGESVSYLLAKSVVGDGFLYIPRHNETGSVEAYNKVALASYLATITATGQGVPAYSLGIELPAAGRGIGTPRARRLS
jgi:hypothetical protein